MVTDRGLARYLARNLVWVGASASEEFLKSPRTKRHILYFFEILKLQKLNEDIRYNSKIWKFMPRLIIKLNSLKAGKKLVLTRSHPVSPLHMMFV